MKDNFLQRVIKSGCFCVNIFLPHKYRSNAVTIALL
jgi:hypothetical protein